MPRYRLLTGLNYPHPSGQVNPPGHPQAGRPVEKRAEAGEIVDDLPAKSIPWLLEGGHIEEFTGGVAVPAPVPAEDTVSAPAADAKKSKKEEKAS